MIFRSGQIFGSRRENRIRVKGSGFARPVSQDCPFMVKMLLLALLASSLLVQGQNTDLFNYEGTRDWEEGKDYGPRDWDQVECDDVEKCVRT